MTSTTYDSRIAYDRPTGAAQQKRGSLVDRAVEWLARIGERSGAGRRAAEFQRLNALTDAQLARMDMKRSDLFERCYGWRAYY